MQVHRIQVPNQSLNLSNLEDKSRQIHAKVAQKMALLETEPSPKTTYYIRQPLPTPKLTIIIAALFDNKTTPTNH